MKTSFKAVATLVLVAFGTLASGAAMAQHHRGHGHGDGHGGNVRFGISLGFPIYAPGYFPAPYYAHHAYVYPAPVYTYPAPVYTYPAPVYTYPAPVYTYPAPVIGSSSAPVYVEQSATQAAPAPAQSQAQSQGDWYYCAASKSYYPYVGECPAGWQRVPAQPPSR